jgi:NADPH:quinone reductase
VRAAVLTSVDGPFEIRELPEPEAEGKALVRVRAAGINFADVLVRRGRYPQMPELPAVLGSEIAGELEDGTRVMALTSGSGGYAELAAVDRAQIVPLPDNASFAEGAAFLITFLSAYIPLTRQVRVRGGSTVLVYAAAGGVGTATIQVARALGAHVIAAVGSAEKVAVCLELGAEAAYVYDELPDDTQVDVVVDPVGGEVFTRSLPLLNPLGAIVAVGFAGGLWTDPSVQWLVGRNAAVVGVYLGRLMKLEPQLVHECAIELLALWAQRAIDPVVGATFLLDDADAAHALIEARGHVGKVILEPALQL